MKEFNGSIRPMVDFENHPLNPQDGVPLFISAGIIKEPGQLEPFLAIEDSLVVPALTLGSFTLHEWAGNAKPGEEDFVYYEDRKLAGNARGLPNPGKEGILALEDPIRRLTDRGIRTIISITNLPHESPLEVIPELAEIASSVNPTAIEVNLSCPNGLDKEGNLHPPVCNDADVSAKVMESAGNAVNTEVSLGAKDSPHVDSLDGHINEAQVISLAEAIKRYIAFLTGINTVGGQSFPDITCTGGVGGASGPAVANIAKSHVKLWRELAPSIPYLSTGGVDSQNASIEIPERLGMGALLVGGAQEFYRTQQPHRLVERWAQGIIDN